MYVNISFPWSSQVAEAAVQAGADIVNDISGGKFDGAMVKTVAKLNVPYIVMHMRGDPKTMNSLASYDDVVGEVSRELLECSALAEQAGLFRWFHVLDPGK